MGIGWIDLESEVANVIKGLDKILDSEKNFDPDMEAPGYIKWVLIYFRDKSILKQTNINNYHPENRLETFKEISKELNKQLLNFIKGLECYLRCYVRETDYDKELFQFEKVVKNGFDGIISFNYTDTFDKGYSDKYLNKPNFSTMFNEHPNGCGTIQFDYIHGKIDLEKNGTCNIVLGIDEYLEEKDKSTRTLFIRFKKYFQRIYKKTSCEYLKWVEYLDENAMIDVFSEIHILGHSLDVTDKDILSTLILTKGVHTKIYHHNEEAHAAQIENLVKVIGFEELNKRVSGPNQSIFFINQNEILKNKEDKVLQGQKEN